jgi:Flp pilus assembly protein protease CpaA
LAFELLVLRQVFLLAGCSAAAATDAKTGLIFDWITYPMVVLGIALNLLEWNTAGLALGAGVFGLGYVIYYMGKIGGGDIKLFTGIAFLMPFHQNQVFLLQALFAACILAVTFYAAFYLSKYFREGASLGENRESAKKAAFFAVAIGAYLSLTAFYGIVSLASALFLAVPLSLAVLFIAFEKGIRKKFFLKRIALEKLEEDEVVAAEFLEESLKKKLGLGLKGVFGKKEVEKLRRMGVKKVPVFRGMPPFAPFVLLGCIAALIQPDLLSLLFA